MVAIQTSRAKQWLAEADATPMGAPVAWGIALAAVATAFAIVTMIVSYEPLNRADRAVESNLPPARFETVAALIAATGQSCRKVCSIAPAASMTSGVMLDVACAADDRRSDCAVPVHYSIAVHAAE